MDIDTSDLVAVAVIVDGESWVAYADAELLMEPTNCSYCKKEFAFVTAVVVTVIKDQDDNEIPESDPRWNSAADQAKLKLGHNKATCPDCAEEKAREAGEEFAASLSTND